MADRYEYVHPRNAAWYPGRPVCPHAHTEKVDGQWTRGSADIFERVVTGNGIIQFKTRCHGCGQRGGPVPHAIAQEWVAVYGIDRERVNTPIAYEPCVVRDCGADGVDRHHFAPRNTFGSEAEDWPILPLCRRHHEHWHRTMDGYLWHRRRAS